MSEGGKGLSGWPWPPPVGVKRREGREGTESISIPGFRVPTTCGGEGEGRE